MVAIFRNNPAIKMNSLSIYRAYLKEGLNNNNSTTLTCLSKQGI